MNGMNAEQVILSRGLPKTGQVTLYVNRDDGDFQVGWWRGRTAANPKTRFIAKTLDGDEVVIDLATGLMWPKFGNSVINNGGVTCIWGDAFEVMEDVSFAGFTDWRLPNIFELLSIINYEENTPAIYTDFFVGFSTGTYWSSTTYNIDTSKAFGVAINIGSMGGTAKTGSKYIMSVRGGR